ncbi:MAG TPA: MarR family transcriptional regulator [Stellaceae bacterium]|nr:MarR family transcriptional regulator [Stellaceae bacterium]
MIAFDAAHPCVAGGDESGEPSLDKEDYEALAAFRRALRQFILFSEAAARQAGLTPQQHQALLAIKGAPEREALSIGELAERLGIRHHSAVGLVDRLVALGIVGRAPQPSDRRRVLVSLTPAAEAMLRDLSAAHRDELQRIGPTLTALLARIATARKTGM